MVLPARVSALVATLVLLLGACSSSTTSAPAPQSTTGGPASAPASSPAASTSATAPVSPAPTSAAPTSAAPFAVTASLADGAQVPVDHRFVATVTGGTVENVVVTSTDPRPEKKALPGGVSADKSTWQAAALLEPGVSYTAAISARSADGQAVAKTVKFSTTPLSLKQQVFVYNIIGAGQTVGVAMPVVVSFDMPIADKASFQRAMQVTSVPAQNGSWRWVSDKEAHWRPESYWQTGTTVDVNIAVNGVSAGNGLYGQESKRASFTVGRAAQITVDLQAHTATQTVNGQTTKVIPVTGGKEGFETRSGTKVIMERLDSVDMNAGSTGTAQDSPEFYDLKGVKYAMRVTQSGEFFHAAPWSVGSQGKTNVSHGCVGMSDENADWLMTNSLVGDPVLYTGSSRPLEDGNGWTDWNISFAEFKKGSAL